MSETTVIVHGDSAAWPHACVDPDCPSCSGVDQPATTQGNVSLSLLLGTLIRCVLHMLVDVGAGCARSLQAARLRAPEVILLTHAHLDHLSLIDLDSLRILAQREGRTDPIILIATEKTWMEIPPFLQSHFQFVEATPGVASSVTVQGTTFSYHPIDASDHFAGAVMYRVELGGIQHGFLFDKKDWNTVSLSDLEGLDIAFLEANTLTPMSAKTGHVSLEEGVQLLRALNCPPKMGYFLHYGHDESQRLSLGDRILHLARFAPDLSARWAYTGMTVNTRHL